MTTYYLSPSGNNSNNGTTSGTPWLTWAKAKSVMVAGDTLLMMPGTYTGEQWVISFSGTSAASPITLQAYDPNDRPIIDGNYAYPVDNGGGNTSLNGVRALYNGLMEIKCSFVTVDGIRIRESQGRGFNIYGTATNRITNITIQNCEVGPTRLNCIAISNARHVTIDGNEIHDGNNYFSTPGDAPAPGSTWGAMCQAVSADHITYNNNDVYHGWGEGIVFQWYTEDCTVSYNRVRNSNSGKIYMDRSVRATVIGNIIWDSQESDVLRGTQPSTGLSVRNEVRSGKPSAPPVNDVLFANNIVVGCSRGITFGGTQKQQLDPTTNVRVYHNIFVNCVSAETGTEIVHSSFSFNTTSVYVDCEVKNNLCYQTDNRFFNSSTKPSGVTFGPNGYSSPISGVSSAFRHANDHYSISLFNPNAAFTEDDIDPEDYRPITEYSGATIAEITLDFYGNVRSSNWMGALGNTGGGGGGTPPAAGSTFAGVAYATAGTGAGTYDLTDSDLDGNTPEAVLTFLTQATSAGSALDHWKIGIGAATAAAQWAMTSRNRDNQAAAVVATQGATDMTTMLRSESGAAVTHESSYNSFIANGVRLSKAGAMTDDAGVIAALFGGSDCEVSVGTFTSNSAIGGTTTVTIGFEYDLLFVFAHSGTFDDTNKADLNVSMGVSTSTSSQFCLAHYENNSAAPTDHRAHLSNSAVGFKVDSGQTLTITTRNSTQFIVTTGVATGARQWGYLALGYTGVKTYCGVGTTPTTATSKKFTTGATGDLFEPGIVIAWQSLIDTLNSTKTDSQAGSLGVGVWTGSAAQSVAVSDQDNVVTTQTKQIRDTKPFHMLTHAGADSITASGATMDSDGTTVTFSAVESTARYFIYIAVEQASTLELTGGLDQGFADDTGLVSLADALTGGLDEGYSDDTGLLSTAFRALPTVVVPRRFPSVTTPRHISVEVYEPLNWGDGAQLYDLTGRLDSYSHELAAFGGYWSASMRWKENKERAEDWLELGLGRRVVTRNPAGLVVWEGFVNQVAIRLGELSVTRGPLLNVTNAVQLTYSWVDPSAGVAIGARAKTDWAQDNDSTDRYGILQKGLSSGGTQPTTADQLRDLYLEENRRPETSQQVSIGSGGDEISVSIDCLGYVHYLDTYLYNQTDTSGEIDLSAKLQAVLAADPNSLFTSTYANITTNETPVLAIDNDDRRAMNIVKDLLGYGDVSLNRYLFGIYGDRIPYYAPVVEQVDYTRRLSDSSQQILTPGGQIVEPWDVQPGKWLMYLDFFVGRVESTTTLRDDPRAVFIESVSYQAPRSLNISGSKIRRLDQKLAQLGLSGIGG